MKLLIFDPGNEKMFNTPSVKLINNVNGTLTLVDASNYNEPSQTTDVSGAVDYFFGYNGANMQIDSNGHLVITV